MPIAEGDGAGIEEIRPIVDVSLLLHQDLPCIGYQDAVPHAAIAIQGDGAAVGKHRPQEIHANSLVPFKKGQGSLVKHPGIIPHEEVVAVLQSAAVIKHRFSV